ncbi:uncharacterized protein LOC111296210 isoform X2 [Durio zibethinus]|uniref:Uncharacterized protein LOC111296210 isoform X2 n=1 Tax=Durio zibethinus TaxID=66656 RepID=A0A6P5YZY5_DURZI|nr:uncharacterized protein LOC111296210 isoform X2 [Durio zibethinus]
MEDISGVFSWELQHLSKRSSETCSDDDEDDRRSTSHALLQEWDSVSLLYPQSNNQPAITSGVVPNHTNGSTSQACQPPNIPNAALLKRNFSSLSEPERVQRKKKSDQLYRDKCKKHKEEMQLNLETLTGENEYLKKENELFKKDNTLMHQTLRDQAKEIDRSRNDLFQLKSEYEKQNVLVQTLSGLLADPVQLENEKLKDENASLRKYANLNGYLPLLAEENANLKIENKVLKVQNDALCGKIISENDKKCEQNTI